MEEKKAENEINKKRNFLLFKPVFNIDLFSDIPREINFNSKNLYLKFYNEHTKKQVLHNMNKSLSNNRYYEQNLEYIKKKQMNNKIQKEKEEKLKNQKEKEKKFEYRQRRMNKLYSSKNFLNNNNNHIIDKSKITKSNKSNNLVRSCSLPNYCKKLDINNCHKNKKLKANKKENYRKKLKMNLSFDDKLNNEKCQKKLKDINITTKIPKGVIVMTQQKYNKKIRTMIKLSKIYENELENIKNKKTNEIEKENNLKLLFNSINDEINKFKKKIDILIIE